jgi:2-polyprenyl-3-methyl-5-hydroxy-6-metoxy-1,4-benzoquinol methylase
MTELLEPKVGLTAAGYQYRLPDHWVMPQDNIFAIMHSAYVRRAVQIFNFYRAGRVLELGCGDGWNCGQFADAGMTVTGVDWSVNGIDHARRLVPNARFVCGDAREPAVLAELEPPFDGVALVEVIEHVPPADCPALLRQCADLLKPGGTLVLTTPSVNFPNKNPGHYRHFTADMLRELVEGAGFHVESIEGYGDVPAERRYYRLARWVDNRVWVLKPARDWLQHRYRRYVLGSPPDRCHGWIVSARRR